VSGIHDRTLQQKSRSHNACENFIVQMKKPHRTQGLIRLFPEDRRQDPRSRR
jgi:hypothetical protein